MTFDFKDLSVLWDYSFGGIDLALHPFFYIDIILVAIIFYYLYIWARNTRVTAIIAGLILLGILFLIARILNLPALEWMLDKFLTMLVIAIPIVLSDELRRFLEKLGQITVFREKKSLALQHLWIEEVINFALEMKKGRKGSLIVIERNTLLTEYIEDGKKINADISKDLLFSIFSHTSPLHDGAVIIRKGKIAAASSILPISIERIDDVGTRHRAALGLSKKSDAIIIVNSEEKGEISLAKDSKICTNIDKDELSRVLKETFIIEEENISIFKQLKKLFHVK